jgi:hypothetical protein
MNKYQPQSTQRPPRFSWVKTKKSNDSKEINSSWPFDPPGKKGRGGTKRRPRAQRLFLEKPLAVWISQEAGTKRTSFLLASRP